MKSERKRLGVRARTVLNRTELRQAAAIVARIDAAVPAGSPGARRRAGPVRFPADPARGVAEPIAMTVKWLEVACRSWLSENGHERPPPQASFRVSSPLGGGPPESATFQWWILEKREERR